MDENNYDRESCSTYFLKYKNCRKFWNSIMIQRRQNGVKPSMPTAAERDEILGAMGKMPYWMFALKLFNLEADEYFFFIEVVLVYNNVKFQLYIIICQSSSPFVPTPYPPSPW